MEISQEERIDIAESALKVVESALLNLKEIQGEEETKSIEFETILGDLKKYCKNQVRISKGY